MAKKFNRARPQKKNIDRNKLQKYREEIARELGVELPERKKRTGSEADRNTTPTFTFKDDTPLY
ncbi:MAG: hypothetical protein GX044_02155 [Firmicutes bacterium]|nr:hypothetical protein [Bacillota bacterium]